MVRNRPLPFPLPHAPFTVAQARERGVGRGRLRGQDLQAPFRGVRTAAGAPATLLQRCRELATLLGRDEFFSHTTALALLGLPAPASGPLHICTLAPRRARRVSGVAGHQLNMAEVRTIGINGLAVAHPVLAWAQCATLLNLRELIVIGDALVCRQRPWSTEAELTRRVRSWSGQRGVLRLRAALRHVRSGTDSPQETLVRLDVNEAGLPEPEVNGEIRDARGRLLAIADLLWRAYRVVLEYDGEQHRTDREQFARDVHRLNDLTADDWQVFRINRSHGPKARHQVLDQVRDALMSRGWRPDAPAN